MCPNHLFALVKLSSGRRRGAQRAQRARLGRGNANHQTPRRIERCPAFISADKDGTSCTREEQQRGEHRTVLQDPASLPRLPRVCLWASGFGLTLRY